MKSTYKRQVRETAAAKQISAYIVLDKRGNDVAYVHVYHGQGNTRVDIFEPSKGLTYQGSAGGYGYDRFTAALAGAEIADHLLYNHCATTPSCTIALRNQPSRHDVDAYKAWADRLQRRGMHAANYDASTGKMRDVYMTPGLRRLEDMGFRVLQVI